MSSTFHVFALPAEFLTLQSHLAQQNAPVEQKNAEEQDIFIFCPRHNEFWDVMGLPQYIIPYAYACPRPRSNSRWLYARRAVACRLCPS